MTNRHQRPIDVKINIIVHPTAFINKQNAHRNDKCKNIANENNILFFNKPI